MIYAEVFINISSLEAWYDSSDITTITKDGSNLVSSWDDKSLNNYDLSASGSARPTWTDNQLNSRAVLDFNGSSNTFALPSGLYGISNGANTVFAVCKTDNDSALQVILGLSESGVTRTDLRYTVAAGADLFDMIIGIENEIDFSSLFCSELVTKALQVAGVVSDELNPSEQTPEDVVRFGCFKDAVPLFS